MIKFTNAFITGYAESEDEIKFVLTSGIILSIRAESQCCDASWFPLSDIEKPEDLIGAQIFSYEKLNSIDDNKPCPETYVDGHNECCGWSYGFNIQTSKGTYHARMANASNGCYSGSMNMTLTGGEDRRIYQVRTSLEVRMERATMVEAQAYIDSRVASPEVQEQIKLAWEKRELEVPIPYEDYLRHQLRNVRYAFHYDLIEVVA
jgi:hypothetical protein